MKKIKDYTDTMENNSDEAFIDSFGIRKGRAFEVYSSLIMVSITSDAYDVIKR